MPGDVRRKWRPGLWAVILVVLGLVLCLPIAGLLLFRFYANQLVQQTEDSLLMQAAVLSATYEHLYRDATGLPPVQPMPEGERAFSPLFPTVTMNPNAVLPPRPDARPATEAIGAPYAEIAPLLSRIALSAQEQSLAGYRILDRFGTVIAGSAEEGVYLGHIEEVALALNGDTVSVPRTRIRDAPEPLIYGLSRGTRVRIFVAMPAMVGDDIIGVVYISRTPNHIFRFLYSERANLASAALFVLISTGLIGFVFWRFISRPIHALIRRTDSFGGPESHEVASDHFGTREIESLAQSFEAMANRLQQQQANLKTYTAHVSHEMKSPLTSIKGAAELLRDADMPADQRERFLDNIDRDSTRMEELLDRMREYSSVGQKAAGGASSLSNVISAADAAHPGLKVRLLSPDIRIPLSAEAMSIVMKHLLENSEAHGAATVQVRAGKTEDGIWITLADDGSGISPGNRDRIFEPFFTSRRSSGGTGMGLSIVQSILSQTGGAIRLEKGDEGATFRLDFGK